MFEAVNFILFCQGVFFFYQCAVLGRRIWRDYRLTGDAVTQALLILFAGLAYSGIWIFGISIYEAWHFLTAGQAVGLIDWITILNRIIIVGILIVGMHKLYFALDSNNG